MKFNAEPQISSEDIVRELLRATKTLRPPTDDRAIADYLNLTITEFQNSTDFGLSENIRAFLIPNKREIGIYSGLIPKQKRYSVLHEIGHFVLPGHATHPFLVNDAGIIEDSGKELSISSIIQVEIEANQFAADCLFQLERFDLNVFQEELKWTNIKRSAKEYDVSFEATARRWIERSQEDCALVVFNPIDRWQEDSDLETMYTITSTSFRRKYFDSIKPNTRFGEGTSVYKLFHRLEKVHKEALSVTITGIGEKEFIMELFSNSYRVFGILTPVV